MAIFNFVDLFTGGGGFTEGMLLASANASSFRLVAASDVHENSKMTHENRFKKQLGLDYSFLCDDIRDKTFLSKLKSEIHKHIGQQTIDVVVGGPPCQGFSVFGKRNEQDPRNDLFSYYLKTIESLAPKYFIMENVPGMATMYKGKTVEKIHSQVNKMSPVRYGITGPIKVNAANYGVPQLRERILFVGHRIDMPAINDFPRTHMGNYVTVKEAIDDLSFLRSWESTKLYNDDYPPLTYYQKISREGRLFKKYGIVRQDNVLANHETANHLPEIIARFAMMEPGQGLASVPKALWAKHLSTSKKWCVRLSPDQPSFTIVTMPDDFIHYSRPRILTVREMARLQSFDDTFEFLGPRTSGGGGRGNKKRNQELPQYSQVGNAVPPLLAKAVGDVLLETLLS